MTEETKKMKALMTFDAAWFAPLIPTPDEVVLKAIELAFFYGLTTGRLYDGAGSLAQRMAFIQKDALKMLVELEDSDVEIRARARLGELYERREREVEQGSHNVTITDAAERLSWDGSQYGAEIKGFIPYFAYDHLPGWLQEISKPFGEVAAQVMVRAIGLGPNAIGARRQSLESLQRLVDAKDAAVRAALKPKS